MQLVLKDSLVCSLYLATPLMSSVFFYHVYLKTNTNVFTAELFSMLSRCLYHSLETAYCIGILPLKFLQYEYIYFDTSRCMVLTAFVTVHNFLSFLCLELHCLGSEVLQQTRMVGEWRWIADLSRLKSLSPKPAEWTLLNCPYPRGAVVRSKGRYYEAMAMLNTCAPSSPSHRIYPIAYVLGDSQRTKAFVLAGLLLLNLMLVLLILKSNQWSMYAVMLIPNCGHFLYVKFRLSHAFFNPAHLNLRQLQWDMSAGGTSQHSKLNGAAGGPNHHNSGLSFSGNHHGNCRAAPCGVNSDPLAGGWRGYGDGAAGEDCVNNHPDDVMENMAYGSNHLADAGVAACLQCPNPLFMSAVSASTMFFYGSSGAPY